LPELSWGILLVASMKSGWLMGGKKKVFVEKVFEQVG
jgi:hypothetical protein